ncbi:hypothetical protein [Halostella litorea]|uniref:hypothetical protein n=1 Tax=Halostella litorea TaxID=2528831 RepID=UPI00192A2972|nr:hypothetical protein [Halostella litorea]
MSQQQMPRTGAQGTQQMNRGGGTQGHQVDLLQQTGRNFESDLTGELRTALEDFEEVTDVTEWCVDQMIEQGPGMATCIRVCQDIGDLADLNARLIARDSVYGLEAAMLFASVAEDGLQEIRRHGNPHCQETAAVVDRAIDSTYRLLESFGEPQLIQQVQQQLHQAQEQFQQGQRPAPAAGGGQIGQQGQMGGMQQPQGGKQYQQQPPTGQQFQQPGQGGTQQPQQW